MADRTRSMRQSILDRDILPVYRNRLLTEITANDLRDLCNKVKARRLRLLTSATSSNRCMVLRSCMERKYPTLRTM